jgi:hypothetical protein
MATFNTLNQYDAHSRIPAFLGLSQFGDQLNRDPRYAVEAENMDTVGGTLQPMAKCTILTPSLDNKIETLARLYRRWYVGEEENELLIAASNGQLYYMHPSDETWTQLTLPVEIAAVAGARSYTIAVNAVADDTVTVEGVTFTAVVSGATGNQFNVGGTIALTATALYTALAANATITATYTVTNPSDGVIVLTETSAGDLDTPGEMTFTGTIEVENGTATESAATIPAWTETQSDVWSFVAYEINPSGSPVDVLLMSNALDGMIMIRGDDKSVVAVETPKLFGVIERHAERIWGGAILDDPDMLVYSAPFDPTDWDADLDIPEDGAGDITQPSWDGDSFTALKAFGDQLIAFKSNRVWRILGTDPGEYVFKEQFGGGAPYFNTIAIDTERILMLDTDGIVVYDGLSVMPFYQEYAKDVFADINQSAISQACAAIWKNRYYCALPLGTSEINNAVLIYDIKANTWLLRTDVSVEAFLPTDDALYFTSSTTPGKIWTWNENAWETGYATESDTRWVGPWNDLGYKNIVKGGFDVYLTIEVQATCALTVTIETEKKSKSKSYSVQYTANDFKQKRLHFGGTGRRFRLIIESSDGALWRTVGGITIISEIDSD